MCVKIYNYNGFLIVGITENDYLDIFNASRIINDYRVETEEIMLD